MCSTGQRPALVLVLDGVTDPHNLGACLRGGRWRRGACRGRPRDRAVGLNATVAKVASGAARDRALSDGDQPGPHPGRAQERDIWVVGTSDSAESAPSTTST